MSTTMTEAPFERARSVAQRDSRVSRVIAATYELLAQSPARTITLGQIGSAAGLAKSGVLRYAGSLEALLLRVMYEEHLAWTKSLSEVLASRVAWTPDTLATALARSLAERPILCDLICTSPVLMGKAGADDRVVVREQGSDIQVRLGACLAPVLPLTDHELSMLTAALHAFTGTAWAWSAPHDEGIPVIDDFETTLGALIGTYIRGIPGHEP
ncbi:TetR/AcrR family transcriptional regulator [Mycobacterium sp. NPDC051804]|uniref:TetR/AcrR family transcriptional regulator n=1 Tax=Mycobacterium sp. NPDC051804 TaxID=3364295 RepID=UPI0037AF4DF1